MTAVDDRAPVEEMLSLNLAGAVNLALNEALAADPTVLLLGEDIADQTGGGVFGVTRGLSTTYGTHRVRSTPISEQAIVGAAIGAAISGFRPVAEIMLMDFLAVAMDQLSNHAAKLRYMSGGQTGVPLTIRTAGGAGMQFGAQHSEMLEAWLAHVPGLKVVFPSTPAEARGLLRSSIEDDDPVVFVEQSLMYFAPPEPVPATPTRIPLGVANTVRTGDDVTVVTWGRQVGMALMAAETVAAHGVSVEVIDLRTVMPWDQAAVLSSVARTGRLVVVHEAVRRCGVGAEIAAVVQEELHGQLATGIRRVGGAETPVPFAAGLEAAFAPDPDRIAAAVLAAAEGRR